MKRMNQIVASAIKHAASLGQRFGLDFPTIAKRHRIQKLLERKIPNGEDLREDGIGLIFDLPYISSHSQVGRDFASKLTKTSIPFCFLDTKMPFNNHACVPDSEIAKFQPFLDMPFSQKKAINFMAAESIPSPRISIANSIFWEFESGMVEARPSTFKNTSNILAFSSFCAKYFQSIAPEGVNVHNLRYPFEIKHLNVDRKAVRGCFGIPVESFAVFFNFDLRSCVERKNPEGAMRAFAKAFCGTNNAILVFKVSGAETKGEYLHVLSRLAEKLGIQNRFMIINLYLSHEDVLSLTGSMDVYISLHRGEGLGLGMLEAISMKVPVVATEYGGNCDFINAETAFPVPFTMVPASTDYPAYKEVKEWAEPDMNVAAQLLRVIRDNPEQAEIKASKAMSFIEDYYSLQSFEKGIKELIEIWVYR